MSRTGELVNGRVGTLRVPRTRTATAAMMPPMRCSIRWRRKSGRWRSGSCGGF